MADKLPGMSEPQAAAKLGVAAVTLSRWRKAAKVSHYRTPGGRIRYAEEHLDALRARLLIDNDSNR